jgi:N-acetylmuramoyl-L-alanine amidase
MHSTWYQKAKMQKEAGFRENLVTVALTSLLMLPFDITVIYWAKKLNKDRTEIEASLTQDIWAQAEEILKRSPTDPNAASMVESAKQEVEKASKEQSGHNSVAKSVDNASIEVVAKTLYAEARGEDLKGLQAVASVIWNRAGSDYSKLKNVCLAPSQFSCWNKGDFQVNKRSAIWRRCQALAESMFNGGFSPSVTATHYYAFNGTNKMEVPRWASKAVAAGNYRDIGNHRFVTL